MICREDFGFFSHVVRDGLVLCSTSFCQLQKKEKRKDDSPGCLHSKGEISAEQDKSAKLRLILII